MRDRISHRSLQCCGTPQIFLQKIQCMRDSNNSYCSLQCCGTLQMFLQMILKYYIYYFLISFKCPFYPNIRELPSLFLLLAFVIIINYLSV